MTPLLKRLESKQLIVRQRATQDERVVHIIFTDAGKQLVEKAKTIPYAIAKSMQLDEESL